VANQPLPLLTCLRLGHFFEGVISNEWKKSAYVPRSAACLILALALSLALAAAQSEISVSPNMNHQDIPNMGQEITPLAPLNSRFVPLNPDLVYPDKTLVSN
jgi:hypothetical protein